MGLRSLQPKSSNWASHSGRSLCKKFSTHGDIGYQKAECRTRYFACHQVVTMMWSHTSSVCVQYGGGFHQKRQPTNIILIHIWNISQTSQQRMREARELYFSLKWLQYSSLSYTSQSCDDYCAWAYFGARELFEAKSALIFRSLGVPASTGRLAGLYTNSKYRYMAPVTHRLACRCSVG